MAISKTEQLARDLMRHYHPEQEQTYGYRPDWLRNPATGHCLELDIWFSDLQSAIEIQGTQHYRHTPGLQETSDHFQRQLDRDGLKSKLCQEWGVKLYHLDAHRMTSKEFPKFLRQFEIDNRLMPSRADYPAHLYETAARLARRRVIAKQQPQVEQSIWRAFWEWLKL